MNETLALPAEAPKLPFSFEPCGLSDHRMLVLPHPNDRRDPLFKRVNSRVLGYEVSDTSDYGKVLLILIKLDDPKCEKPVADAQIRTPMPDFDFRKIMRG